MDRRSADRRVSPSNPTSEERRKGERRTGPRNRRGLLGQRHRFIVPGSYQIRAIFGVAGLCLLLLAILDFTLLQLQTARSEKVLQAAPELADVIRGQDRYEMGLILLASAVGLLAIVAIVVFESHKTAGPLYSLKRAMSRLAAEGPSVRAQFRRDDHFKDLQEAFNQMASALEVREKERSGRIGTVAEGLRRAAEDLAAAPPSSNGTSKKLAALAADLDRLKHEDAHA